jgi:hypothetical protein
MLSVVMLSVIMINVTYKHFVMSVVELSVVRLNAVLLSVVAPCQDQTVRLIAMSLNFISGILLMSELWSARES